MRQREIVADLPATDELGITARQLLVEFEKGLRDHKAHLAQLERAAT